MSRSTNIIAAAIFIAGMTGVSASMTAAASDSECPDMVNELRNQARGSAATNRAELVGLLDQASAALASGGSDKAVEQLSSFRSHLKELQNSDKLSPNVGEPLITSAGDAIVCIQQGD